ncbi:hypothetical protein [Nocardia transvalensis]|uniref:hypothetical protein n=1 Tax=Nocardia transvalensis TaxID=37333 RepID=UPI0018958C37|nr:hypothetical protein [Nocardia transvalensis]MBF6327219.1 hypothetical protein [Nocardia transvalensis]
MDGSRASTGDRADDIPRRLNAKVAGPAIAAGAVSVGLVLIGSCGLGRQDVYVAPPPLHADLQSAPPGSRSGTTTPAIVIPPSPTWRIAVNAPPRRTLTSTPSSTSTTTRPSFGSSSSTSSPTRTTEPSTTTEPPLTTDPFDDVETTTSKSRPAPTTTRPVPPTSTTHMRPTPN